MRNIFIQAAASVAMALAFGLSLNGAAYAADPGDTAAWNGIRGDIFGTREILVPRGRCLDRAYQYPAAR
jgi:hypothetical protein